MSVLYVVVPLAVLFALIGIVGFIWAARGGQYDDTDTPAHRMLHDDED